MKILFVSGELTGSGLCQKLISEGNHVKLFILRKHWKDCYSGIVEKTTDWKSELAWVGKDGLIIFDDVVFGEEQDTLRKSGYTVVGGSAGGDRLEIDREYFQIIAHSLGMNILPSYNFNDPEDAIDFIVHNPSRWVVKQSSHISSLNFVGTASDGSDAVRVLQRYKKRKISPVHIQRYVQGIEVGVARYFNGTDWVGPIEINHEHKKLHENDRGPLTPEMGTVLWYTDREIRLFSETLGKFKSHLQKIDFRGDFDINFIVNEEGAWPLEATPRFGAPSTQVHVALHKTPWVDFLSAVGGKGVCDLAYHSGYGVVISVAVPPFPYEPDADDMGSLSNPQVEISIDATVSNEDMDNIHFEEVSKINGAYIWSGKFGLVFHVTAHADTISEAKTLAYTRLSKIKIPKMYYRTDIGDRVESTDIPQLKIWGWI